MSGPVTSPGNGISPDLMAGGREGVLKMRIWKRDGYKVVERPFDFDLHHFDVVTDNGYLVGTLCPATIADMQNIVAHLDAGADVDGWEDGAGSTIRIHEMKRLPSVEKYMGIDCEVWAFVPDDATYVVVVNGEKQIFDLSDENWQDDEELASLLYDRLD